MLLHFLWSSHDQVVDQQVIDISKETPFISFSLGKYNMISSVKNRGRNTIYI